MAALYLVDGTFELFRCFHGAPRATGAGGREMGAARGLLATLTSLVATPDLTHVAVAFDSVVAPPGRGRSDEAMIGAQAPLAAAVVRALGIPVWPSGRFQADEILASAAAGFAGHAELDRIVLCTNDNDFAQCVVGDRVVLLDRIRRVVTDEAGVVARFGVRPHQIPDLFGLIGDRSDGLPGVPGWGPVSAARVLARYGRLDEIPLDAAAWDLDVRGRERLAASFRERRAEALLCRDLSILRTDLPVPGDLAALAWVGARRVEVAQLVAELGESTATERLPRWADD